MLGVQLAFFPTRPPRRTLFIFAWKARLNVIRPVRRENSKPFVPTVGGVTAGDYVLSRVLVLSYSGATICIVVSIVVATLVETSNTASLHVSVSSVAFGLDNGDAATNVLVDVPHPPPQVSCRTRSGAAPLSAIDEAADNVLVVDPDGERGHSET